MRGDDTVYSFPQVVKLKVAVTDVTPLPEAFMVMVCPLTTVALLEAFRLIVPEVPVPGWVIVAVTPVGRVLTASETPLVKPLRVRVTVTLWAEPPRASVIEVGLTLLIAILGVFTVRLKVEVTDVTPLPLAVIVIVCPATRVALLEAVRLIVPEFPVPGWV